MVSLAPISQSALGQVVVQEWAERLATPLDPLTERAVGVAKIPGWNIWTGTTGTRDRVGAGNEIATIIYVDSFTDSLHLWPPVTETWQAEARVIEGADKVDPIKRRRFYIGGRQSKSQDPGWAAVVLAYQQETGGFEQTPAGAPFYLYGDDLDGDHVVVEMDTLEDTPFGPVVAVVIQTAAYGLNPPSSRLVVLGAAGNVVIDNKLDWIAKDVKLITHHDGPEWFLRAWVIGNTAAVPSSAVIHYYGVTDMGDKETGTHTHSIANTDVILSRMALGPGPDQQTDIFIAGYTAQSVGKPGVPFDPAEMLTIRFGDTSGSGTPLYGIRWLAQYPADRDAIGFDVAASQVEDGGGANVFPVYIFTVGYSERQIGTNPDIFTRDFTVLCYEQGVWTPGSPPPAQTLHWDAKFGPLQNGDDMAYRVMAAPQAINNEERVTAVVTGVRENSLGHWDWLSVKYTEQQPVTPPKTPRWDIAFSGAMGDDVVAGLAITNRNQWKFPVSNWLFWAAGHSFHTTTGDDYMTVHYREVDP